MLRGGAYVFPGKKQKTHTKLTIGILILMIITMIGLSSMMIQQSKSLIMNETQRYLSELSKQTSSRVDQNIAKNIAQLREVSANLSEIATTDAVGQTIIDSVLKENDFSWIGYVDMNGLLHVKIIRQSLSQSWKSFWMLSISRKAA